MITWTQGKGADVPYGDLVDEVLCFGWIDSLPRRLDDHRCTMLLMSPLRKGSGWSAVNMQRVALFRLALLMLAGLRRSSLSSAAQVKTPLWEFNQGPGTFRAQAD